MIPGLSVPPRPTTGGAGRRSLPEEDFLQGPATSASVPRGARRGLGAPHDPSHHLAHGCGVARITWSHRTARGRSAPGSQQRTMPGSSSARRVMRRGGTPAGVTRQTPPQGISSSGVCRPSTWKAAGGPECPSRGGTAAGAVWTRAATAASTRGHSRICPPCAASQRRAAR